jgi:hypothetical protein
VACDWFADRDSGLNSRVENSSILLTFNDRKHKSLLFVLKCDNLGLDTWVKAV